MSRKGHSELLLLGSFSGCSQALSPSTLVLSWMLNACQPLISSLSIREKAGSLFAALMSLSSALSHLQLEHASKDQKKKELRDRVFS